MDHKSCRQQSLNIGILCCRSSSMLFPKINMKPANDTSTRCGCSSASWGESHRLSVIQIVLCVSISPSSKISRFHMSAAPQAKPLSSIFYCRTIASGGILFSVFAFTRPRRMWKRNNNSSNIPPLVKRYIHTCVGKSYHFPFSRVTVLHLLMVN